MEIKMYLELKKVPIEDGRGNVSKTEFNIVPGRVMASNFQANTGCRIVELLMEVGDDIFDAPTFVAKELHPQDIVDAAVKDLTRTADDLAHVGHPS